MRFGTGYHLLGLRGSGVGTGVIRSDSSAQFDEQLFKELKASLESSVDIDKIRMLTRFIEEKKWDKALFLKGLNHIKTLEPSNTTFEFKQNSLHLYGFKYKEHQTVNGFYESCLANLDSSRGFVKKVMLDCYNVIYTGEWDKMPNGQGEINYGIADIAKGEFRDGKMVNGKIEFKETSSYRFPRNQNFIQKGKETYSGMLKATDYFGYEVFDGAGTYRFKNGDVFIGNWVDHLPNGRGTLILNTGESYEGNWVNGYFQNDGAHSDDNSTRIFFNRNPKPNLSSQIVNLHKELLLKLPNDYEEDPDTEVIKVK